MKTLFSILIGCLLAVTLMAILSGCNSTTFTQTAPDGSQLTVSNHRLFWQTGNATAAATTSNGSRLSLTIANSKGDAATIQAVAAGVAAGLNRYPPMPVTP